MNIERLSRPVLTGDLLSEAKSLARIGFDDDDADLSRMIDAAAAEAEELAQIALINQTIRVTLDAFPRSSTFPLPIAPLLDWSTVQIDADDAPFDDFSVMTGLRPAIRLTGARPSGAVVIEYQAGFGADGSSLPVDLRHAILDQAAAYYDARGPGDPKVQALSPHFVRIVGRYRRVRT